MHYAYRTAGVCSSRIDFDIEDGVLHNVVFTGGCPGNLLAIPKLIEGQDASLIADILAGNPCGGRSTSCADQLSIAIRQALAQA